MGVSVCSGCVYVCVVGGRSEGSSVVMCMICLMLVRIFYNEDLSDETHPIDIPDTINLWIFFVQLNT